MSKFEFIQGDISTNFKSTACWFLSKVVYECEKSFSSSLGIYSSSSAVYSRSSAMQSSECLDSDIFYIVFSFCKSIWIWADSSSILLFIL